MPKMLFTPEPVGDFNNELATRIMSDVNRHRAISEMHWRNKDFMKAIEHRCVADGLQIAHDHLMILLAEAKKAAPDTQEAS